MAPPRRSNLVGQSANFAIQYNLSVLSVAVRFMTSHGDALVADDDHVTQPDLPEPAWVGEILLGMVFAGTIVGMTALGVLGDVRGRRTGMLVSLALVMAGALAGALLSWGPPERVYAVICACRLLIGIGVGGMYPNGAALSAESAAEGESSAERVGWAFFWQTPGSFAPYIVAYALLLLPASTPALTSVQFRLLLAIGALPAAVVFIAVLRLPEPPRAGEGAGVDAGDEEGHDLAKLGVDGSGVAVNAAAGGGGEEGGGEGGGLAGLLRTIARYPQHGRTLVGTASTWLLYDVNCYGTSIFTPVILGAIFTGKETLSSLLWQSLASSSFGLLGILAAIPSLKYFGGTWLSFWGFAMMGAFFAAFGVLFTLSPSGLVGAKFAVFCAMIFSQAWGCNLSTYVLPTQLFPREVRATFHGLSAASGKVGAVIGTFAFVPVKAAFGIPGVMWLQLAICVAGALCTHFLLPDASPAALARRAGGKGGHAAAIRFEGDEAAGAAGGDEEDDESEQSLIAGRR